MGIVAEACHSFVLDNGAFSVWKRGEVLDVAGYVEWVRLWRRHPGFDWALIPDVIDGDEYANDALLAEWPADLKAHGVPVWHLHESPARLLRLAQDWPIVALGSSGQWATPGNADWWVRMRSVINHVCDHNGRPLCHLHGLRMLSPAIFTKLPLKSADSTNVGRNCNQLGRFGMYLPPTTAQRAAVIADRVEANNSAPIFERTDAEWLSYLVGP